MAIKTRFQKELSGELGEFWANGVAYNCIDRVVAPHILERLTYVTDRVNVEATKKASDAEAHQAAVAYRAAMANHVPSDEEMYEMRAAFGEGGATMKAADVSSAWEMATLLMPVDFREDLDRSKRAGYPVYYSTDPDVPAWISDLGCRLEVNLSEGKSINILIESNDPVTAEVAAAVDSFNEVAKAVASLTASQDVEFLFSVYPLASNLVDLRDKLSDLCRTLKFNVAVDARTCNIHLEER